MAVSVREAVASGDFRQALDAMADTLAVAMETAAPAVVAQIAGRLQAVLDRRRELDLENPPEESATDTLRSRAADRLQAADVVALADRRRRKSG